MRKICVAGCSVSDYTVVDSPYGKILANLLDYEYIHEGAGCGSNYRIWRTVTNHIIDGNLTPDDLLVVQYTESFRNEFWSPWSRGRKLADDSYNNGAVIRWKPDSYKWQHADEEKEFHEFYGKYFVNISFADEQFRANNFNFQHMLKSNNIRAIFLQTTRIGPNTNDFILDHFKPWSYFDDSNKDQKYNLREGDRCHFSQEGHEYFANELYNHIKKLDLA